MDHHKGIVPWRDSWYSSRYQDVSLDGKLSDCHPKEQNEIKFGTVKEKSLRGHRPSSCL